LQGAGWYRMMMVAASAVKTADSYYFLDAIMGFAR
jgi:hypothetical protein